MGILLFVLKYIVYFLASEDDNGVFWPAKIMASPFKVDQYIEICLTSEVLFYTISSWSLDQLQVTYMLEVVLFCLVT